MPDYRRAKLTGGTFFFTVVTFNRLPILTGEAVRKLLHDAWMDTRQRFPFQTEAVVLLPDHIHCIWTLPKGDANFSMRWNGIKRLFTKGYLAQIGPGVTRNVSRQKRREAAVWQRRFWEHTLRDEEMVVNLIRRLGWSEGSEGGASSVKSCRVLPLIAH